jgi:hypothetical protein
MYVLSKNEIPSKLALTLNAHCSWIGVILQFMGGLLHTAPFLPFFKPEE